MPCGGAGRLPGHLRRAAAAAVAAGLAARGCRSGGDRAEIRLFLHRRGQRDRPVGADPARAAGARRRLRDLRPVHQAAGAEKPDAPAHPEAPVADGPAERDACGRRRARAAGKRAGARPALAGQRGGRPRGRSHARAGRGRQLPLRARTGGDGRGAARLRLYRLRLQNAGDCRPGRDLRRDHPQGHLRPAAAPERQGGKNRPPQRRIAADRAAADRALWRRHPGKALRKGDKNLLADTSWRLFFAVGDCNYRNL